MKRWMAVGSVLLGLLAAAGVSKGDGGEIVLLDAPRGSWLASLRSDAPVQVLEERDGWRHVRVEGWVSASTTPAGAPSAAPGAAPASPSPSSLPVPPAAPVPSSPKGAAIAGVLVALPGMQPATPGGNLVVQLIGDTETLDADLKKEGEACHAGLQETDAAIAALEDQVKKALNSTTNFTDATHRYDRAKSELAAAKKDRASRLETCRDAVDARLAARAVARVLSDPAGRFEFKDLAAGRYRVVASDRSSPGLRVWSNACVVASGESLVLDPRTATVAPDPYAGLR